MDNSDEMAKWIDHLWARYPDGFTLIFMQIPNTGECDRFAQNLLIWNEETEATGLRDQSGGVILGIAGLMTKTGITEALQRARAAGYETAATAHGEKAKIALEPVLRSIGWSGFST